MPNLITNGGSTEDTTPFIVAEPQDPLLDGEEIVLYRNNVEVTSGPTDFEGQLTFQEPTPLALGPYDYSASVRNVYGESARSLLYSINIVLPSIALFGGGVLTAGDATKSTCTYVWSTNAVAFGSDLLRFRSSFGSFSIATKAVFFGGNNGSGLTETYVYATSIVAAGPVLLGPGQGPMGCNNATVGIVNSGAKPASATTATQKYDLANDTLTSGATLTQIRYYVAAFGNATVAIFANGATTSSGGGTPRPSTDKYTYVGDVVSPGNNLGLHGSENHTIGCSTYAVTADPYQFAGSPPSFATRKYLFAGDVVSSGATLAHTRYGDATASDPTRGLFAWGYRLDSPGGQVASVESYDFATEVVAPGVSLPGPTSSYAAGASSNPGNF